MTDLTGQELEDFGQEVFTRMGLTCIHALNQARLRDLDPPGPYSADDHLEFDYLIPCGEICLIGEITGRSSPNSVRTKYSRFRRHYGVVRNLQLTGQVWQLLGVPSEHLRDFRGVTELKCFFVTTRLERFDVNLPEVDNMARFYKPDWDLLVEYSHSIGIYAKHHFLYHFDVAEGRSHRPLMLCRSPHGLMRTTDRKIASGNVGLADVYTFEVSPYDLLPIARVFRRDELPNLAPAPEPEYQRPLMPDKLDSIRGNLLDSPDFMFPNSILVVLSSDCRYLEEEEALMIPDNYGAVSVIDGQHRLFSYADEGVRARIDDGSRIVVTAIQFRDANAETAHRYSAKTFVEINTNQTRIRPTHLDAISYEILGETHPRAIAAQVILRANERRGSLYGFFNTNQTNRGVVEVPTVLAALKSITNLERVRRLQRARRGASLSNRCGYETLLNMSIDELGEAETLIGQGVICLERYFSLVSEAFQYDWPRRGQDTASSLQFAKMIAGFVKLLRQFIAEGLDWEGIQAELESIRTNVMQLRDMQDYDEILFDPNHSDMPDFRPSATDDYRFLNNNRENPTSIQDVITP